MLLLESQIIVDYSTHAYCVRMQGLKIPTSVRVSIPYVLVLHMHTNNTKIATNIPSVGVVVEGLVALENTTHSMANNIVCKLHS